MKLFHSCLFALLAAAASNAPARELTEAEYLASFGTAHPARAVLDEAVGRARADVRAAGAFANPVAGFERESPGDLDQDTWALEWTPPLDGRRSARKHAAEAAAEAAGAERLLTGAELRASLREVFANWALTTERASILAAHNERLREVVTHTTAQAQSGHTSRLAAQRIELAALEVIAEAARADAARMHARAEALSLLGAADQDVTPLRPPLPEESAIPDPAGTAAVGARRLQLAAASALERSASRFIEFPSLMFGWQTVAVGDADASGPVFGVAWPIPIFDRRQGERDAAKAAVAASQARLDLETARVTAELSAAAEGYERLRAAATDAQEAAAVGDTVLRSAVARFEAGESDVTELLETVRGVLTARLAALDLYETALAAHRELDVLIGRSWPTEDR